MKYKIVFLLISILGVCSCNQPARFVDIKEDVVTITGKIDSYRGVYKTGKLTYFDAVTRIVHDKIFAIDSLGRFSFSFNLTHPLLNSTYFDIEGNFFSNFLIKPNTNYDITVIGNKLIFNGKTGEGNREISEYKIAQNTALRDKISRASSLHEEGLSIGDYISFQKELESEKASFLKSYYRQNSVSEEILSVLQSEIKFEAAHAIINYRFDYSLGFPMPRKSLPEDFYIKLFNEYSIQGIEDFQSRACIDYIANIVEAFSNEAVKTDEKIKYFKSFSIFSPAEIDMLYKLFSGDRSVSKTEEFKELLKYKEEKILELNRRYCIQLLLQNANLLGTALTKDLVISQGIAKYYFSNNLQPTVKEWKQIENLIDNKSIFNYIKKYSLNEVIVLTEKEDSSQQVTTIIAEEVKARYIDKYKGKVIYIDFYTTWCGPCREEIPYAKQLYQEFKNKDVVFLNLCVQSKKEDWENLVKQNEFGGENYLLNNEEFYLLSKTYKVSGFPTYILIDKNGDVSDYSALRPSAKKDLYAKINELILRK